VSSSGLLLFAAPPPKPISTVAEFNAEAQKAIDLISHEKWQDGVHVLERMCSCPLVAEQPDVTDPLRSWIARCREEIAKNTSAATAAPAPTKPAPSNSPSPAIPRRDSPLPPTPTPASPVVPPSRPHLPVTSVPSTAALEQQDYSPPIVKATPSTTAQPDGLVSLAPPGAAKQVKAKLWNIVVSDRYVLMNNLTTTAFYCRVCSDPNAQKLLSMEASIAAELHAGGSARFAMQRGWQSVTIQTFMVSAGAKKTKVPIGDHQLCFVTLACKRPDGSYAIAWESRAVPDRTEINIQEKHVATAVRVVPEVVWETAGKYISHAQSAERPKGQEKQHHKGDRHLHKVNQNRHFQR